jgi:hypothetical protein
LGADRKDDAVLRLLSGAGFPDDLDSTSTSGCPSEGLPFTRSAFDAALRQARQAIANELDEALDPNYTDGERSAFRAAAFGQRVAIGVFADLIGDTSDDLDPANDPTPAQVRSWGVTR